MDASITICFARDAIMGDSAAILGVCQQSKRMEKRAETLIFTFSPSVFFGFVQDDYAHWEPDELVGRDE